MLALLADDLNAAILAACRHTAMDERALVEATGAVRNTLSARLAVLQAHGLLERRVERTGARGRPSVMWTAAATGAVDAFARSADAFALELLDLLGERHREAIDDRRRDEVRSADGGHRRGEGRAGPSA